MPSESAHAISVPGAAAGWCDAAKRFGTMPLAQLLAPAIELAEEGFPVHEVAAAGWAGGAHLLTAEPNPHGRDLLMPSGRAPAVGDVMKMPKLANTFRLLAEKGRDGFYKGEVWCLLFVVFLRACSMLATVECILLAGTICSLSILSGWTSYSHV